MSLERYRPKALVLAGAILLTLLLAFLAQPAAGGSTAYGGVCMPLSRVDIVSGCQWNGGWCDWQWNQTTASCANPPTCNTYMNIGKCNNCAPDSSCGSCSLQADWKYVYCYYDPQYTPTPTACVYNKCSANYNCQWVSGPCDNPSRTVSCGCHQGFDDSWCNAYCVTPSPTACVYQYHCSANYACQGVSGPCSAVTRVPDCSCTNASLDQSWCSTYCAQATSTPAPTNPPGPTNTPKPGATSTPTKTATPGPTPTPNGTTVDLKANGSDGPLYLTQGESITLTWTSTSATSCTASGSWSGTQPTAGSWSFGISNGDHVFTLQCTNGAQNASDSVSVSVRERVSGHLYSAYSGLVYKGPRLPTPQPGQYFRVSAAGGYPPYTVAIYYRWLGQSDETQQLGGSWCPSPPDGAGTYLTTVAFPNPVNLAEVFPADPLFGVDGTGRWDAWARISDSRGHALWTCDAGRGQGFLPAWMVTWYPVYNVP